MTGDSPGAIDGGKKSLLRRLRNSKVVLWWSIAWAIGVMALAPLVNFATPFLEPSYANAWTPDIFWRLVMYWHGGIFIPWITVLAVVACMKFHLDTMPGMSGRLIRESVIIGGLFAVPIAGIAGVLDVYDRFAWGVPLWSQIGAFLIGDEMAVALIVAMLVYPRAFGGGFRKVGMPYYTVFTGVFGALVAAMMGHVGGWITWFGPNPQIVANYVNATEYPVLNYYNDSAVVTFTQGVVGSHSHLMLVALMAGVVALVAVSFGYYEDWSRKARGLANLGFAVMVLALLTAIWIYVVSGVGNYPVPAFFTSGPNGVAGDDLVTGTVGFGAAFVLVGLLSHSRAALSSEGKPLFRDPIFLSIIVAWVVIYLVIPVTGFYINFNEAFFQNEGAAFDAAFTRFHQDFGFFVLPALITMVLALDSFGVSGRIRRVTGYLLIAGVSIGFVFGEVYTLFTATANTPNVGQVSAGVTLGTLTLDVAVLGGVLMAVGGLVAALQISRSSATPRSQTTVQQTHSG